MSPQRIQRKRTPGWKMPEGAVYVGRPSKWGNSFVVGPDEMHGQVRTADIAVAYFRAWMLRPHQWLLPAPPEVSELTGKDLACWCPIGSPCHADVLLEIANGGVG